MIIYSKTLWGLPLLSRVYGSALPRALAPALLSGLVTLVLLLASSSTDINHLWAHPFAYQPFAFIVSFVLAFRSNYAYQRHWEAYTQKQIMTARWIDATIQALRRDPNLGNLIKHSSFEEAPPEDPALDSSIVGHANWRDIFMLRGSSYDIRKYNSAQPLSVIGGLSQAELAAIGCCGGCPYGDGAEEEDATRPSPPDFPVQRSVNFLV
eukprot:gene3540-3809_t